MLLRERTRVQYSCLQSESYRRVLKIEDDLHLSSAMLSVCWEAHNLLTTAKYAKTNKLGSFDGDRSDRGYENNPGFVSIPAFGLGQFSLVTQDGFRELVEAVQ